MKIKIAAEETTLIKESRKQYGDERSKITLKPKAEDHFSLFIERKKDHKYRYDNIGLNKFAYPSIEAKTPNFVYYPDLTLGVEEKIKQQMTISTQLFKRAAYYGKLKPQTNYGGKHFFKLGTNLHFFSEYIPGQGLKSLSPKTLKKISIENRLKWLLSSFKDLQILHENNLVHGNIHELSFIVDLENNRLHLTDFLECQENGSENLSRHSQTYSYDGTRIFFTHFITEQDMYAMRMIVAFIFPELFIIHINASRKHSVEVISKDCNFQEKSVLNLLYYLNQPQQMRWNVHQAVQFCTNVLAEFNSLDQDSLQKIINNTLYLITYDDRTRQKISPKL